MKQRYVRAAVFSACVAWSVVPSTWCAAVETVEVDSRLKVVPFEPRRILELTGFVGYHVNIEFAPDEHFVSLGAGDTAAIDVGSAGNHLLLKPRVAIAGTNLTVMTNRRTYYFDYHALARRPRADEATYAIEFTYPLQRIPETGADLRIDALAARLDKAKVIRNTDYWYCGSSSIQPRTAADDGIQLRLTFGAEIRLPSIYELAADGTESLVNSHVEQDAVYVHHLASRFILRRGSEVGCVVNRTAAADTRRPVGGTIDDETVRVVRKEAR
ncbi:MAG: TrbG/VirB9 family P-type conjugative transfer protein [Proteobacteria bacterium]|nr:TrbG/VirB9 family P-type conjugative transfer protein [Pseudomonadota bacterium]